MDGTADWPHASAALATSGYCVKRTCAYGPTTCPTAALATSDDALSYRQIPNSLPDHFSDGA